MMVMTSQGMAGDQDDGVNQNLWAKIATITITVNITPTDIYTITWTSSHHFSKAILLVTIVALDAD